MVTEGKKIVSAWLHAVPLFFLFLAIFFFLFSMVSRWAGNQEWEKMTWCQSGALQEI
jgi:hypothetical protein